MKRYGLLPDDDLAKGQYVCVHSLKGNPEALVPIMGQSLLVKAVCRPFFLGQMLSDPDRPIVTLDLRHLNLMRVTKEYVEAQQGGIKPPPDQNTAMQQLQEQETDDG